MNKDIYAEDITLSELREVADSMGLKELKSFTTKQSLITVIELLKEKKDESEKLKEVVEVVEIAEKTETAVEPNEPNVIVAHTSKKEIMRLRLEGQPKKTLFLPLEGKEIEGEVAYDKKKKQWQVVSGTCESCIINGFVTYVPKGKYWEVPEQVFEVFKESQTSTQRAGQEMLMNRINPETGTPVSERL